MKKFIILFALVSISCTLFPRAPRREIGPTAETYFELVHVPEVVSVGDEVDFTLKTEPGNLCFGFIWYITKSKDLVDHELEVFTAGDNGICTWKWIIPDDADHGRVSIEVFIVKDGEYTIFPTQNFCISKCP